MDVRSPFDNNLKCTLVQTISSKDVIEGYLKYFDVKVERYFKDVNTIYVYKCPVTEFEFFYPFGLDGDSEFYEKLSKGAWYYQKQRWEHQKVAEYIKANDKVLEIGSGSGAFASILQSQQKKNYTGLELNDSAVAEALKMNINVLNETMNIHKSKFGNTYDVVCSFQVFEHVSSINELFIDSISVLKQNGKLIVAVPNNDLQFIRKNVLYSKYLNMPPHHVNLFNTNSLTKIASIYGLKLESLIKEPIQDMHIDSYLYNKIFRMFFKKKLVVGAFWKLNLHVPLRWLVKANRNNVIGHTIIATYIKTEN